MNEHTNNTFDLAPINDIELTNSPLNFISLNCGSLRSNAKKAEFLAPVNE